MSNGEREGPGRARDLDRLLTFVDAIVAIAITLLVLPLVDLTLELRRAHFTVAELLRDNQPELWSFLLSFVVIARLWFGQHDSMRHVLVTTGRLSLLMVFWALTIVFLPFPTALVAQAGDQAASKILYIGTITVSTIALTLINSIIERHPQITDGETPNTLYGVANVLILLAALALSLAVPALSYFPMLLLFFDTPVERLLARFTRRT